VGSISGLLEIIQDCGGREDLPALAEDLRLEIDDLLPAVDALAMLGFAKVAEGDVVMTNEGQNFAVADVEHSKELFRQQLLQSVPLIATILGMLKQKRDGRVGKDFLLGILDEHFSA
jgi:NitT/TauT family transport system ATP-binding protein